MKNLVKKSIYVIIFATIINIASLGAAHAAISTSTLIDFVNSSRAQSGLAPLSVNEKLQSAALSKAQDMFANQYFAHTSPQGKTPWDFINQSGYTYVYAGENLAIGYNDNNELHTAWMNSPSHRENILNPNFKEIGIAQLSGTFDGLQNVIVVQTFGSKDNAPAQPLVNGTTSQTQAFQIDVNQSSVKPAKIFSGDEIELKATLKGTASSIYFNIGDQKIDISNSLVANTASVYDKKIKFEKTGTLPITLVVEDKQGNRDVKSLGNLVVAPRVLAGTTSTSRLSNFSTNPNFNYLVAISVSLLLLIGGTSYYIIYKRHNLNSIS